ncbi:TonB-dependent receptor [Niastella caeni]|uniref:TonB-dependent receptor n=1 Tax=Niastella caeni TaxID=2569763 RepID=A0A4S8H8H0_9BACT|nr:carboxypeptidase-like regulatory domain-containing protein [Niastella caeni]THU30361.1 TonB-dependent receptor [Niastella caeni]
MKRILSLWMLIGCCLMQTVKLQAQDISKMTISIELKNVTLAEAFSKIESLTSLKFNYKTADVADVKGITYQQQKVAVKKVLNDLLSNTSLQYEQLQQYIIVKKRPQQPAGKKGKLSVTGMVKEAITGEPLPYVNIAIAGLPGGFVTNAAGLFTIHDLPDTTVLIFTAIGHQLVQYPLYGAQAGSVITVEMKTASRDLGQVTIAHKKSNTFKLNQQPGMLKLSVANIATLPRIGEKDIFRSFQLMPGISAGNEQSAGLYVRGGTPDQNLILFDGFTVYNVDHLYGFFSTFNANAIKDVQLFKSGFDAKYGGRLSALAEITGKEGNRNHFNAGVDLGLLSASAFAETPIGKKITALASFRRSFKTPLYDTLLNHARTDKTSLDNGTVKLDRARGTTKLVSGFDDMNVKLTYRPTEKDGISASFYHGKDQLNNHIEAESDENTAFFTSTTDNTQWGNTGASLKWNHKWNAELFSTALISYSNYFSDRTANTRQILVDTIQGDKIIETGFAENNDLKDYTLKAGFEWMPNATHTISGGIQLTRNHISYQYIRNDSLAYITRDSKGNTNAVYIQDKLRLLNGRLVFTPGIRISHFDATSSLYHEPRLTVTYDLSSNIKLKGSAGQYYQFAKRVIREDILNGNRDFWVLADNEKLPVSSSRQVMAGASWENNDLLVDVEAWYKKLRGLSEYTLRYQPNPDRAEYEELFYEGTGYAQGIDVLLQKKFGKYTGWIAYTLSTVKNNFPVYGPNNFFASNDVRNECKIIQMYSLKRWDFAITWLYLTGKPYTAPTGGYQISLPDGTIRNLLIVSDKNTLRLPDYHRLDAAVNWHFGKPGKRNGTIGLSVFNAYNRRNLWYKNFQIVTSQIVESNINYLGITPNLNVSFKWR